MIFKSPLRFSGLTAVLLFFVCAILLVVIKSTPDTTPDQTRPTKASPQALPTTNPTPDVTLRKKLASLGYAAWAPIAKEDAHKHGVVHHDRRYAYQGINVYGEADERVLFMDMEGKPIRSLLLDKGATPARNTKARDLLKLFRPSRYGFLALGAGLYKLDEAFSVMWRVRGHFHHDFCETTEGHIYVLGRKRGRKVTFHGRPFIFTDNSIVELAPDGTMIRELWLSDIFLTHVPEDNLDALVDDEDSPLTDSRRKPDLFHANTIELIRADSKVGNEGNILISVRNLDLIAIVDVDTKTAVWEWGPGIVERPHHPTILGNGNIMVFDNGTRRGFSRILEIDPITKTIVWEYKADPPEAFFSPRRGSSYPLPNGNILVTESTKGRAFEVSRDGNVVWEFWNPVINDEGERATFYRVARFEPNTLPFPSAP